MVGHKLAFMHHAGLLLIVLATGETAAVVSGRLCFVLFLDGGHLYHTGGHGGGSSSGTKCRADDGNTGERAVGDEGVHGHLCNGLCYLYLHLLLVVLRLDLGLFLFPLLLQHLTFGRSLPDRVNLAFIAFVECGKFCLLLSLE